MGVYGLRGLRLAAYRYLSSKTCRCGRRIPQSGTGKSTLWNSPLHCLSLPFILMDLRSRVLQISLSLSRSHFRSRGITGNADCITPPLSMSYLPTGHKVWYTDQMAVCTDYTSRFQLEIVSSGTAIPSASSTLNPEISISSFVMFSILYFSLPTDIFFAYGHWRHQLI